MECIKCKKEIPDGSAFCCWCGKQQQAPQRKALKRAKGELLISGYAGQKVIANFRKRDYYPLLERLGIPKKTPHAARHTFASWAVANNIKPELLQKMLGHADYSTTANIYEHFDIDQLIDAIDAPVTNALLTNQKSAKKKKP